MGEKLSKEDICRVVEKVEDEIIGTSANIYYNQRDGGGNELEFDELRNTIALGVFEGMKNYDSDKGASPVTYAFWKIRGAASSIYDRKKAYRKHFVEIGNNVSRGHVNEDNVENRVFNHEFFGWIHEKIFSEEYTLLTEVEKECLKSYFFEDMTLKEAGEKIGVSHETFRKIKGGALKKLKKDYVKNFLD